MSGYIKLYRDLQENPLWQHKPFSKGQAWVDMMLRCNHICKPISGFGNLKWVKRGEFVSSNYKLAEAWGWSESAVRNFMRQLEYNNMIFRQSFGKFSLYFLQNYAHFQSAETEDLSQITNVQKTRTKRAQNAQKTPNNNIKNDNNDNKDIYSMGTSPTRKQFIIPSIEEVKAYCKERNNNVDAERWHDYYSSNGWRVGKNPMRDWKASVRTWEKDSFKNQSGSHSQNAPRYMNFDQRKYDKDYFEKIYKAYDQ